MGAKKKRKEKFLRAHPLCCLCGGAVRATTEEHSPAKILFVGKLRPAGHEVPACYGCNIGSGAQDQMVAALSIGQSPKLVFEQNTSYFAHFMKCANGIGLDKLRSMFDEFPQDALVKRPTGLLQPAKKVRVRAAAVQHIVNPWAVKTALSIWYLQFGISFSEEGIIGVRVLNIDDKANPAMAEIVQMLGSQGHLQQGKWDAHDQFCYQFEVSKHQHLMLLHLNLHVNMRLLVIASDRNEETNARLVRYQMFDFFQTNAKRRIHPITPIH